jgi:hypothetical protein
MYFEAETYYCKKLNKLNKIMEEKDAILERQTALIMHLIKYEQDLINKIEKLEPPKEEEEEKNKRTVLTVSMSKFCTIM